SSWIPPATAASARPASTAPSSAPSTGASNPAALHQVFALQRTAHLGERLLLKLADALAREVVLLADLLQRQLPVGVEPEALAQDVGLDRLQRIELRAHLFGHRLVDHRVRRRAVLGV